MWRKLFCLALAAVMLFGGGLFMSSCRREESGEPPSDPPPETAANDMTFDLASAEDIQVHDFNLGVGEVFTANNHPVSAPLAGIIAVPDTNEPRPLVVIFHGASMITNINENTYAGFDYLVRQLAAQGYVAMSVNVNVNYAFELGESAVTDGWAMDVFDYHLDHLLQANNGQDVGHGLDLTGAVDFDNIHLIGHSRGGDIAGSIAFRELDGSLNRTRHFALRSVLRIAPIVSPRFGADGQPIPYPDLPFGIILPEFDGDACQLDGQLVFDEVFAAGENQSFGSLVYLLGANHNNFNRKFTVDDRENERSFADPEDRENWLSREQQEDFLKHYTAAFLAVVSGEMEPFGKFDPSLPQPDTLFGYAAASSTYLPGTVRVADAPVQDFENVTASDGAAARFYVQTIPAESTEPGLFNHPAVLARADRRLPLYQLEFSAPSDVMFLLSHNDFSAHTALSFYISVDMPNPLNTRAADHAIDVILTAEDKTTRTVHIPAGTAAIQHRFGRIQSIEGFEGTSDMWMGRTPLSELRIPLTEFSGVNLSAVTELTIRVGETAPAAFMLSGIYLVK